MRRSICNLSNKCKECGAHNIRFAEGQMLAKFASWERGWGVGRSQKRMASQ